MAELQRHVHGVNADGAVPHRKLVGRDGDVVGIEMGRRRERFSGTDALSMSIAPIARGWIKCQPHHLVLGEGDRLAVASFMRAAADAAYVVTLLYLQAVDEVLDERCELRGSAQNRSWRAGRATKAANLIRWASGTPIRTVQLDSTRMTPERLAEAARAQIPALKELR